MIVKNLEAYRNSVEWAQSMVKDGFVSIDTETTSIEKPQICEISLVSYQEGKDPVVLLNKRVRPSCPIEKEALGVHGITEKDVENMPVFTDIWVDVLRATTPYSHVLMYNAQFDLRAIRGSFYGQGVKLAFANSSSRKGKVWHTGALIHCVMERYADYVQMPKKKGGGFKYQKLPAAPGVTAHTSSGDCISLIEVVKEMAGADING